MIQTQAVSVKEKYLMLHSMQSQRLVLFSLPRLVESFGSVSSSLLAIFQCSKMLVSPATELYS